MSTQRNERRLTARSVLLSVLLGTDPPRLGVGLLVRTTQLFGIAEGTTRTALSRMVAAGELRAADGRYELAGAALLHRRSRQEESRRGRTGEWNGRWCQAVVDAPGRRPAADRARLRADLLDLRLAELRDGVWMRPDDIDRPELPCVRWFTLEPLDDAAALAARLWPLDEWAAAAVDLRGRMRLLVGPLERGDRGPLAEGFVLSAAVLRHLRADPRLPDELLPARWPGGDLRHEYDRYDRAYRAVLRDWFDAN